MNNVYVVRFLAVIAIVVVLVLAVVQIANLTTGGGDETDEQLIQAEEVSLRDFATDESAVRYTIDGIVNGRNDHRAVRVTIDSAARRIEILDGYSGNVIGKRSFKNDLNSYRVFLKSIEFYGFDNSKPNILGEDFEGICPLGKRYISELFDDEERVFLLWRASCSTATGNASSINTRIRSLFRNQIPDYYSITREYDARF